MKGTLRDKLSGAMRRQFLAGMFIVLPLGATILILVWVFQYVDSLLRPLMIILFGRTVPGLGFAFAIVLVYLIGLLASTVIGTQLIRFGQSLVSQVPVVKPVYSTMRQISESFSNSGSKAFKETVLVEYPRKGVWAIAFTTGEVPGCGENRLISIYVPGSPNPTSGFLQILREDEVIRTCIPVNEAMKSVISVGMMCHPDIANRLVAQQSNRHT